MQLPQLTDLKNQPFTQWNGKVVINSRYLQELFGLSYVKMAEMIQTTLEYHGEQIDSEIVSGRCLDINDEELTVWFLTYQGFLALPISDENPQAWSLLNLNFAKVMADHEKPKPDWQHLQKVSTLLRQNFTLFDGQVVTNSLYLCKLFNFEHSELGGYVKALRELLPYKCYADNFILADAVAEVSNGIPTLESFYYLTKRAVDYLVSGFSNTIEEMPPFFDDEELTALFMMAFESAQGTQPTLAPAQSTDSEKTIIPILTAYLPMTLSQLAYLCRLINEMPDTEPDTLVIHACNEKLEFICELDHADFHII